MVIPECQSFGSESSDEIIGVGNVLTGVNLLAIGGVLLEALDTIVK